jgi:hypothetical protein
MSVKEVADLLNSRTIQFIIETVCIFTFYFKRNLRLDFQKISLSYRFYIL